jgi:Ca2+-binding RTX toxin-like protein
MRVRGLHRSSRRALLVAVAVSAIVPASAGAGHILLDHPPPAFTPLSPPSSTTNSGGPGAKWELIDTIATGNPHTDIDFFTQGGNTYASVGTLAIGPNAGGQTIVQLTQGDEVAPRFVSSHPSASCLSNPSAALGLQHDVEAAPKGGAILNTPNESADRTDTQLLIDASDAEGRCHDQGVLGVVNAPLGGLEIVDVTDVSNPVEIGLTSHIGESHTVNVDPKRPHIAYAVTSDAVSVSADDTDVDGDGDTAEMVRENEDPADSDRFDLDGFEVVDFSSCMDLPGGASVDAKRGACRPQVYRYRYPTADMALGHTIKEGTSAIFGCHELEVYPDDRLTCGSGNTLIGLDMSGAFNDMGTPTDYTDDKPRGTPLPCTDRPSSSAGPFATGATVIDCVDGSAGAVGGVDEDEDLTIPGWLAQGAPSLEGVRYLGSIYHQGGGPGQGTIPPFNSVQDLAFNHESELSGSGRSLIATDERGGGVFPPGATCSAAGDNLAGNGGVHFYKTNALSTTPPGSASEAQQAYARTPGGDKAIYRAEIRTPVQGTVCTAHVFQQIPGENRIFMGWYSQGTQVIDFVENRDGTVRFADAGHFIPERANTWVSHIFKHRRNEDGTETYWGATGDFTLGEAGRNAIDVYKVTLPPAPLAGTLDGGLGGGAGGGRCAQEIRGSKSADRLLGSIAGDRISGRGGNDRINGRAGDDCLRGGGGKDRVKGASGLDQLNGGRAKDKLNGGGGKDKLNGGGGKDKLKAGGGKDKLKAGGGKDKLKAGGGRDKLRAAGGGRDLVDCGGGRDRARVDASDRVRRCERVKTRSR